MEQLTRLLSLIGVGRREVEIYVTLVERGALTAREIADILGIPYTKVYAYLSKLEKYGVVTAEGRPYRYKASPPAEVYKKLVSMASESLRLLKPYFDSLQLAYESKYSEARPTFLTLVRGVERVGDLIMEVLAGAEEETYLALPFQELLSYRLLAAVVEESKRVNIKLLTTVELRKTLNLPPRVEVRTTTEMFGGGAIGSAVVIFVKHRGEITGVYSNERYIIDIARTYFNHIWTKAAV